jgi:hypothetical protein|tara:strand:- start:82 stop:402 length:321 start_codon:yes stop_codon:yes gene_type:complete
MRNFSFEELMEKANNARKNKNMKTLINVNQEFNRRVKKRIMMGKKPMKTSLAGQQQTKKWIENDPESAKKIRTEVSNKKWRKKNISKIRIRNLTKDTDINKKKTLW